MKTKFRQGHQDDPMTQLNLQEVGSDLAEEANYYFKSTEDIPDITGAEVATQLDKMLQTDTIKLFLASGDYGRGMLIGIAIGVFALELAVDTQLATRAAEEGGEEGVDDEEIEDIVYSGLKHGIRGGGGPQGDDTIN